MARGFQIGTWGVPDENFYRELHKSLRERTRVAIHKDPLGTIVVFLDPDKETTTVITYNGKIVSWSAEPQFVKKVIYDKSKGCLALLYSYYKSFPDEPDEGNWIMHIY